MANQYKSSFNNPTIPSGEPVDIMAQFTNNQPVVSNQPVVDNSNVERKISTSIRMSLEKRKEFKKYCIDKEINFHKFLIAACEEYMKNHP